ncbi:aminopeptidase N [Sulfitobacter mediterraneus]|uniref:aminopeptidase N n=1 Tax=Sulfitobacter mediterraneus TaxID=83219 RepID=UPI00193944C0|nr:aminopeptidase N [Sulfitobacter mediterraneus]MBM1557341.1 aminopeptidase N [Sulfitobacter mediterraneus]MBM1568387.1 aminopeptidase N [Sulfitobacter mediterraneus]MBM1572010.1 aminopeptidase N [Sulfitobacter mediterraneus]MBM1575799.1 aminopeptidase N [Sulfitobacter mediterraneus]MBM1580121.1 aminopeptidase N [Sulfitobacter mediterraneus]
MPDTAPETIYLADYTPFGFIVDSVALTFDLDPRATRVTSRIAFRRNPEASDFDFFLHGEQLKLVSAKIDGAAVSPKITDKGLSCDVPDTPFVFEAEVEIDPTGNTALEGLYMSNGMYCTQCEAEGFRKITYYPDRPDVMATFEVTINGPHPVLLSNGNPVSSSEHHAKWYDPWPKPAYLFALVAGDLIAHPGEFTTQSGRKVDLNLYVRPGDEGKCAFGMEALIASMKWDEEVYGREYDLDLFNIVAVDDFNMGAMENKGLNIFNSSAVLASPETSTDMNFERIEAIIAHEYFHNWTGNRITCRDWFQLCLKEGLTVYRDSQFTSDMRSAAVKRISDVIDLRGRQFAEDQGPLAHPVRPESFQEINNFYTATVYEKGAEVIGMLKTLVGDDAYAKALDLYFERHDGDAATIEDWLKVFEDTTGRDLSQFKRWYGQAGTPRLSVEEAWEDGTLTLTFAQHTPPSVATPDPQPQVIPIATGLIGPNGNELAETRILEMTEAKQSFVFEGLGARPVASVLRGFSAPVVLTHELSDADRAHLLAHDTDTFNRWEAGRTLARQSLLAMITKGAAPDSAYLDGIHAVVCDASLDPAYRALMLGLPSQSDLASALHDQGQVPDPAAIYRAGEAMRDAMAARFADKAQSIYDACKIDAPYDPGAEQAGKRSLGNAMLSLITRRTNGDLAQAQYDAADNMTQQLSALACLIRAGDGETALAKFESQWRDDRLVMDKWFGLQVLEAKPEEAAAVADALTKHSDFNWKNPNRFRAVFGSLSMHHAGFHHASGDAYALLADWLIKLDAVNPQTTARMCTAFQTWKRYDADRQAKAAAALDRILATPDLSPDTTEMLTRIRGV